MSAPIRLLVVCLGNICRSPMAEGALRHRLAEAGLGDGVSVDSAGLGSWHAGQPPDPRAVACAARHGVDIADQQARQLRAADYHDFDWLLCADHAVLADVRKAMPAGARAKAVLMLGFGDGPDEPIPDPYTGGQADFEHAWALVDAAAGTIVRSLHADRSV